MSLSTQPYKGARDFYPEDKRKQDYMFSVIRSVVKRFGYEEYDAPLIEPLELYSAKSGEEIVNEQTYNFQDRGKRNVVIRPEMTPSVSRMVAARRQELAYPLRWFSIPNLWRYERPQRGRLREHWQLNVDIFGVGCNEAELELMMLTDEIFKAFGADQSSYEIRVNNRKLMDYVFTRYLGLEAKQALSLAKIIDRKAKIDHSQFLGQIDQVFSPSQKEAGAAEKLLAVLAAKKVEDLPREVSTSAPSLELKEVLEALKVHGIGNSKLDISLMRGFDYYSGVVFELYDTHPENNRSMMGGGRYDGLVGLFGVEPVPTVGFGLGDTTLANFLELHHLMPELATDTDIYLAVIGDDYEGPIKVAGVLRSAGVNVAIDFSGKKLGQQLKTAQKKGIRYALIVGEKEISSAKFTLRDLNKSTESSYPLAKIATVVQVPKV